MKRSTRRPKPATRSSPNTALVAHRETTALAVVPPPAAAKTIVEKLLELARDPGVDVVKINALIDANERVIAIGAKQQFDEAFAAMQAELPVITKLGLAVVTAKDDKAKVIRSTPYTRDVDITLAVRPILARFGFALRHRNAIVAHQLTVTGILSHRAGHREEDTFGPVGPDDSGYKSPMQAWASARSYGKRYTTISLLNISSEDPVDGEHASEAASLPSRPPAMKRKTYRREAKTEQNSRVISDAQRRRLFTIIGNSGRTEDSVRAWLHERFKIDSTKEIERRDYDWICETVEAPGELPLREPGEEG